MTPLTRFLYGLAVALCLALALLGVTSCALESQVPPATAGPIDSLVRTPAILNGRKIKFKGPVTFQVGGQGNTASTTTIGKAKAPTATAPQAVATDASRKAAGTPWWVFAVLVVVGGVGGFLLARRLPKWLPI
jgi:hypothetical protein